MPLTHRRAPRRPQRHRRPPRDAVRCVRPFSRPRSSRRCSSPLPHRGHGRTGRPRRRPLDLVPGRRTPRPRPGRHRYFRTTFTAPAGAVSEAQFVVTGDDSVDVWLNGKPVGASPRAGDSWHQALYVDLRAGLTAGANTLAVAARNTAAGPAGVLGRLRVVTAGGTTELVTDGGWKAEPRRGDRLGAAGLRRRRLARRRATPARTASRRGTPA